MLPIVNRWKIPIIFFVNLFVIGLVIYVGIEFISDDTSISYGGYIFYVCLVLLLQLIFNTLMFYRIRYKTDQTLSETIRESGLYGFISFLIADIVLAVLTFL